MAVQSDRGSSVSFSTGGASTFVAVPSGFRSAALDVRNVVKLEYAPRFTNEDDMELEFSTDRALIDFRGLDLGALDMDRVVTDCKILGEIASNHPDDLKQIVAELQKGTSDGIDAAQAIAERIGATEEFAVQNGGGLFFLLVVAAAAVLGSGCVSSNNKVKNATTTPKPANK